jgi:acyl-CoA dehydrogenase
MNYRAPINELRFALNTHGRLPEVLALPNAAGLDEETVAAILEEAGKFAEQVLAPTNRQGDLNGARLVDGKVVCDPQIANAFYEFRDAGWMGLRAPADYDGQGLPATVAAACEELWCSANLAFSLMPMLTLGALEAINHHASAQLKQKFLPNMANGIWSGTMNLTEPQAGTDLAQVASKAVPKGDAFAISGQKIFITWGDQELTDNVVHLVLARLPDAPQGVKGISLFIVPKYLVNADGSCGERNGVHAVSLEHKMGIHASPTCVMQFENAEGYLIGEAGHGLSYMFTMMNHARLGVGIEGHAVAERAYQHALAYANERVQSRNLVGSSKEPVTIIHHPDVRRMLLVQKATLSAQRALYLLAGSMLDSAANHPSPAAKQESQAVLDFLIPIVKAWCTENGTTLTNMAMQVFGGMGYVEETGAAQHVRDVRITQIYEGTNGVQALDLIGRKTAANGGMVAKALIAEGKRIAAKLEALNNALGHQLNEALVLAEKSVDYVVNEFVQNRPDHAATGSLAYLMQMGTTIGAVEMARAYLVSDEALKDIDNAMLSEAFYEAKKRQTAVFFNHVLPNVQTYSYQLLAGADSILSVPFADYSL